MDATTRRLPALALIAIGAASIAAMPAASRPKGQSLADCSQLANHALHSLGVTPASLAAVGVTSETAGRIAGLALASCATSANDMEQSLRNHEALAGSIQTLEAKVRTGQASATDRSALAGARASLRAQVIGDEERAATLKLLVEGALTQEQRTLLANVRAASHIDAPMTFKIVPRSNAEWVAVRDHPASFQNEPAATVARELTNSRLASIAAAWREGLGGR